MSQAWASGSSRAWRRLRLVVLERDRHLCQYPVEGWPCGQPAKTVGHLDPLCQGNPKLASIDRLRAECTSHNYGEGARLGNARRPRRVPRWAW